MLAPPAYAAALLSSLAPTRATVPDTEAAAAALESEGLATVRDGYAAASGRP